jgi:predicted Na+-dependent transporter
VLIQATWLLAWLGARARWVLAAGVLLATLLPALSAWLRPFLPALVVLTLCLSMSRLDLGALARRALRPRRLALLAAWCTALMVLTPALAWAVTSAIGLAQPHVAALTYTFAAAPITSAAALCFMLGLDAALALEVTIFSSMAMPLIGPIVVKTLLGDTVPIDAALLTLRVGAMVAAGTVLAIALRWLAGHERIERNAGSFDGIMTLALLMFVIPLFDRFWELILAMPWFAGATLALVLVGNLGAQALSAAGLRRVTGPEQAGAAGLMWGNRNVATYLAALPPDPLFTIYVGFYQLPMLFTPLIMGRLLRGRAPKFAAKRR